jgi:hypothetical protein
MAGVTNSDLKSLGRNKAKLKNQFGSVRIGHCELPSGGDAPKMSNKQTMPSLTEGSGKMRGGGAATRGTRFSGDKEQLIKNPNDY